ncbi:MULTISPECIES: tRNA (adenosine(37)-N6)-threonylcarbamoyltransferase complex transferase subunit TsaD [unclassified Helicobacter]|uniref:tRNA (adenosine(37)-N6)-threonylcarbamoyltransferase complex transferase subunit TsaD n=1 Tax=unclassified Helicobacter TaxID=2593540 RepID=UPI000CF18001|nr:MULTISPECIES: tRNA (adenosine(37)-N6)-threonylcarbamoyltransferase complex transferase subunit TsaD [unclassified Helicobacter]
MILSIESSCDDSSIAITQIEDARLIWHKKISQEREHSNYGGVVPEIASRMHANDLPKLLYMAKSAVDFKNLKAIAITTQPGLSVTLIEGLMMAKVLSLELQIPLIGINHLKGHIYSLFINQKESLFPMGVLLVSGGHTQIIEVCSKTSMRVIANTLDDSFGESFDKVAKMLGLTYPGGPIIQELAQKYDGNDLYSFPVPLRNHKGIAFSFSGLKNAVRLVIEQGGEKAKIAKSFQNTACNHILQQTERYFKRFTTPDYFAIVGGASANVTLRERMQKLCKKYHKKLLLAPLEFCSDNAAMIGRYAIEKYVNKDFDDVLTLQCLPRSSSEEFERLIQ